MFVSFNYFSAMKPNSKFFVWERKQRNSDISESDENRLIGNFLLFSSKLREIMEFPAGYLFLARFEITKSVRIALNKVFPKANYNTFFFRTRQFLSTFYF